MAAKPGLDASWSTDNDPADNVEPTAGLKTGGVPDGGVIAREYWNYLQYVNGEYCTWVENYAMDKENNLSELTNKSTARANLGSNNAANLTAGIIPSARLPDATLTFTGDATGSGTMVDLGSVSITLTVGDDSHSHTKH